MAEDKKETQSEQEIKKQRTESKWQYVVNDLRRDLEERDKTIADRDELLAEKEKQISDLERVNRKLEENLKQSEADFVYLSKAKADDGVKPIKKNFLEEHLEKKGVKI